VALYKWITVVVVVVIYYYYYYNKYNPEGVQNSNEK